MSTAGPGRRETAIRLFAVEFDESSHSYRSGEEERAPIYVVSPTGARINRLFVVGVLTESTWVNEETIRVRIADPTGSFVAYAGQYQPDARAKLDELADPAFVAMTGKANVFEPEDGDRVWTSIRPEAVAEVDAETRDRWVVNTADRTFDRIGRMAAALDDESVTDEGIRRAREAYAPTPAYLAALYQRCVAALEVVTGEREGVDSDRLQPDLTGEPSVPRADLIDLWPGAEQEPATAESTEDPAAAGSADSSSPSTDDDREGATDDSGGSPSETLSAAEETAGSPPSDDVPSSTEDAAEAGTTSTGSDQADRLESEPTTATEDVESSTPDEMTTESDEVPTTDEVLDEEEREAVEAEFGTDFSTGADIPEPETPETEPEPDPESESESESESVGESQEGGEEGESLVDIVMATMAELDDGSGVPRDELVDAVTDRADVSSDAADQAITDALMDGRCYEPTEDIVQPI